MRIDGAKKCINPLHVCRDYFIGNLQKIAHAITINKKKKLHDKCWCGKKTICRDSFWVLQAQSADTSIAYWSWNSSRSTFDWTSFDGSVERHLCGRIIPPIWWNIVHFVSIAKQRLDLTRVTYSHWSRMHRSCVCVRFTRCHCVWVLCVDDWRCRVPLLLLR